MKVIARMKNGEKQQYFVDPGGLSVEEIPAFMRSQLPDAAVILVRIK